MEIADNASDIKEDDDYKIIKKWAV